MNLAWVKVGTRNGLTLWKRLDEKNRYGVSKGEPPAGKGCRRETALRKMTEEEATE